MEDDKSHHSFGTPGGKTELTPGKTRKESGKKWNPKMGGGGTSFNGHSGNYKANGEPICGLLRNKRDVWTVTTSPYADAHFATFPPDLIKPCILAGTRTAGKRCDCAEIIRTPTGSGPIDDPSMQTGRAGMNRPRRNGEGNRPITKREQRSDAAQLAASPHRAEIETMCGAAFAHYIRTDESGARPLPEEIRADLLVRGWLKPATPCDCPIFPADVVLDPFGGSGTTGKVALELGRRAVLVELNPEYAKLCEQRCTTTRGLPLAC